MRLRPTLAACCMLAASLSGCLSTDDGDDITRSVTVNGVTHSYHLYIPSDARSAPTPLVIALHGGGGNTQSIDTMTHLRDTARREGFLYLRPEGYNAADLEFRTWNAGSCCGAAEDAGIDHVAVISRMLDDAESVAKVDPRRVFVTGHSNGGMMAYRLACALSDRIAAIAPNASYLMNRDYDRLLNPLVFACQPTRPVPVLHMHGLADTCAPFDGGQSTGPEGGQRPPAQDSIDAFVANNRCNAEPVQTYSNGDSRCVAYSGCEDGADVVRCTTDSAGHVWAGSPDLGAEGVCGGHTTTALDANSMLWSFFRAHPMP
jgi:polyhydroxybutyrate depolymerase